MKKSLIQDLILIHLLEVLEGGALSEAGEEVNIIELRDLRELLSPRMDSPRLIKREGTENPKPRTPNRPPEHPKPHNNKTDDYPRRDSKTT